mmetsp:Transcript_22717/g.34593  ORF Transcript_22717/g.34593 Transcript_22717/m.34593 type:complete len:85 (+) Transcript_22717:56-310(+)
MSCCTPLDFLAERITKGEPVIVFVRNNKKLFGFIRAFDKHINLVLEDVKEIWTTRKKDGKISNHEKMIPKMILRGDSVVMILQV